MMPTKSEDDVANFIQGHLAIFSHRSICDALIGVVNKKNITGTTKLVIFPIKDIGLVE